jgi:hypothetical protein
MKRFTTITKGLRLNTVTPLFSGGAEGDRTRLVSHCINSTCETPGKQIHNKLRHKSALPEAGQIADEQNPTPAEQKEDPISHKKYALCMQQIPADLRMVVSDIVASFRWNHRPSEATTEIASAGVVGKSFVTHYNCPESIYSRK